jgi:hypothetical protein
MFPNAKKGSKLIHESVVDEVWLDDVVTDREFFFIYPFDVPSTSCFVWSIGFSYN